VRHRAGIGPNTSPQSSAQPEAKGPLEAAIEAANAILGGVSR
jgi:hypothetical protein